MRKAKQTSTKLDQEREGAENRDWADIDPAFFAGSRSAAPPFPLDALPARVRDTVSAIATARCVNIDLAAASTIAIVAGAIGNRVRLQITDRRTEPGTLFVALVVEPGQGKSEAIDIARECFEATQNGAAGEAQEPPAGDHLVLQMEHGRHLSARKKLAAEGISPSRNSTQTSGGSRSLLLSEATVAGIRDALAVDPCGRTLLSDELLTVMNLTGGREAIRARGLLLEAFDGKRRVIVNARDGEIEIEALQLTILGATQPDRVPLLLGPAHDGLAPRFLWCAPDVLRFDAMADSDGPIDELITALTLLSDIRPNRQPGAFPQLIPVSVDAREALRVANANWNARMPMASALIKSLLARARTQALRLAFNLALCERALAGEALPGGAITAEDVERGVTLMENYFLPMGERVVTELTSRATEPASAQLARYLARLNKPVVNEREDIRRGVGSPVRDTGMIAECLEELRLRDIVKPQNTARSQSGRPAKNWEVNPRLTRLLTTVK